MFCNQKDKMFQDSFENSLNCQKVIKLLSKSLWVEEFRYKYVYN